MSERKFILLMLVMMTLGGVILVGSMYALHEPAPKCPTEDSCHIDYHDGAWHITEER